MSDDNSALIAGVAALLTSMTALITGLYGGRNARLKDQETSRLERSREEDRARASVLADLTTQNAWLVKRVRELEDEIRDQRSEFEKDRRAVEDDRDGNMDAFNACYEYLRNLRHDYSNLLQKTIAVMRKAEVSIPDNFISWPGDLPDRRTFIQHRK